MSERLKLNVGDFVRHIKRGTEYQINWESYCEPGEIDILRDGMNAVFVQFEHPCGGGDDTRVTTWDDVIKNPDFYHRDICIGVSFQMSTVPQLGENVNILIYEDRESGKCYARPEIEFTDDRFMLVSK